MAKKVKKVSRSAKSGKFVDKKTAQENPDTTVNEKITRIPKKGIPNPKDVPDEKHDEVIELVKEQFFNGHYNVKVGSVQVIKINDSEDRVMFIRTHDPAVKANPHGIKGVK